MNTAAAQHQHRSIAAHHSCTRACARPPQFATRTYRRDGTSDSCKTRAHCHSDNGTHTHTCGSSTGRSCTSTFLSTSTTNCRRFTFSHRLVESCLGFREWAKRGMVAIEGWTHVCDVEETHTCACKCVRDHMHRVNFSKAFLYVRF